MSSSQTLKNCLQVAYKFYSPRAFDDQHLLIWQKTIGHFKSIDIENAFEAYYAIGKHMPKPAEIIDLIRKGNPKVADRYTQDQALIERERNLKPCAPIIAAAWARLHSLTGLRSIVPVTPHAPISDDAAIIICNYEAQRRNIPSAIPPEFWIREIWGCEPQKATCEEVKKECWASRPELLEPNYQAVLDQYPTEQHHA